MDWRTAHIIGLLNSLQKIADPFAMQLPAPVFDRLIRTLSPAQPASDQRRYERIALAGPATILPLSDDVTEAFRARVADVSADGIALLHDRPMTVGGEFLLQLPPDGPTPGIQIRCLIRSSTLVADGCHRIGAAFDGVTDRPCLLELGAREF